LKGSADSKGYLSLILHAHLPFVRHPEFERFLEENWFFEALTESYIPLLNVFDRLVAEGIAFRLTLSLSPTLVAMLQDPLLQERYLEHMGRLRELAGREVERTRSDPLLQPLARMYQSLFAQSVATFERWERDLVRGFRHFQQAGVLELITCAATHGYLPLLRNGPGAVRAQVLVAAQAHERVFGSPAPGIWLPECGYYPGLEQRLQEAGFGYFILDSHGLLHADQRPRYGVYAPLACRNGLVAFARDPASSRQVWSALEGYPGDPEYREFYRDIGYSLEEEALTPFLQTGQPRVATGIKYWRITDRESEEKHTYDPHRARQRVARHAEHFLGERVRQVARLAPHMDRPPLIVAPYDAELFGHWWFEGPQWLESLIRKAHGQDRLQWVTPSDYIGLHPLIQQGTPSASSWGDQGYNRYWLNESNAWIYPHLDQAARRVQALALQCQDAVPGGLADRALAQAARSLLLAQASDWAFMLRAGTTGAFAEQRVKECLARFHYLDQAVTSGHIDERKLRALETLDAIFPDIDYRWFLETEPAVAVPACSTER